MGFPRKTVFSVLAVFAALWVALKYLLPLLSPFLLGAGLALAAEPMVRFLSRRAHMPRAVSTAVGVSMAFCFLAMGLLMLCAFALRQLKNLAGILPDLETAAQAGLSLVQTRLLELASHAPRGIRPLLEDNVITLLADSGSLLGKLTAWLLGLAGSILTHVPDSALGLGTAILSAFLISAKLPRIKKWLLRRIPKEQLRAAQETARRMRRVLGRWLLAQCKLMSVTFIILAAGLTLLRIPRGLMWALLIALVDALPILGTGTVMVPWSVVCFLQGDTPRALGLLGIYITAALTRSMLEPKLLGKHLGLDPLVTLIALYVGYRLWGVGGMILAPLLTVAVLQLRQDIPGAS
ncbi:MAG: sporulation integral membrane protein YtvI [Eubacteriales bacterium]|nr:sporulation integral membrane protein YtvI [Eubacteriales bacterium]